MKAILDKKNLAFFDFRQFKMYRNGVTTFSRRKFAFTLS